MKDEDKPKKQLIRELAELRRSAERLESLSHSADAEGDSIRVSNIDIEWNTEKGTCTFETLPVAMMWIDTTLAGLMSGVQQMVGSERFGLALQSEGRNSVEADWTVIEQFADFREGFRAIANIAAVAGWGEWELVSHDEEQKTCRFQVRNSWEGRYQKALGVCWGSGMLAGKLAGYCSRLFRTNCWAEQTAFIARGDESDEFVVSPSERTVEQEIENLLASDEATRADLAVALGKLRDELTERSRMERELRRSEEKYRVLVENAPIGIISVDRDGGITEVNSRLLAILGSPSVDATKAINMLTFAPLVEAGISEKVRICMEEARPIQTQLPYTSKWGKESYLRILLRPITVAEGDVIGCQAVVEDVTTQIVLEKQLQQAQKMEAIGTLAGGVAHDFNNLLQVVLGYADMLLMDKDAKHPDREALLAIRQAGRDGGDLVKGLLTFSARAGISPRPMNLNQEVRRVQAMLYRTIPKMIKVEVSLEDGLKTINADPGQMEQILLNLAVNARDAMPGGGTLTVETENVSLTKEYCETHLELEPGEYVLLTVSDTGHGIARDVAEHIFEPFYTTKAPDKGTGLGLATVFGIVRSHQGYIKCCSEPGIGTAFKIYLPVMDLLAEPDVATTREMPAFGTETILLVDDEEHVRNLGERILTRSGYTVLTARNGKEALEVYRHNKDEISLVILDLIMPEMGGKQCLEEILRTDPQAKVLVTSGYSVNGPTKDALEVGATGFINKPYDIKELARAVRKVLDEAGPRRS
jgi:PAS domain S-box-containing protein